jgi:hypothetical protein
VKINNVIVTGVCSLALTTQLVASNDVGKVVGGNEWNITDLRANERVWSRVDQLTNHAGNVEFHTNRYVELENGLNYMEGGQWKQSSELIKPCEGGAEALCGQHKAYFSYNLLDGIRTITPEGVELRSLPLGISYFDGVNSVLIAELKNCVGEIIPPNQIIYRNAFTDFEADVCYTYTKSGIEQDLILREQPTSMPDGINPDTARLQLLTEFINPPRPVLMSRKLKAQSGVELPDQIVQFGSMSMGSGRSFFTDGESRGEGKKEVRVGKQFLKLDGRDILIEEIPVKAIESEIQELPKAASVSANRLLKYSKQLIVKTKQAVPTIRVNENVKKSPVLVAVNSTKPKGYLLDYSLQTSLTNFTFDGSTTYVASNNVSLSGTVTFQGGTIIKLAHGASLNAGGNSLNISTFGNGWRPVIITASDDDTVGNSIPGSTGNPNGYYGRPALGITTPLSVTITNFRILYAQEGLKLVGPGTPTSSSVGMPLFDVQFVNCGNGVNVYQTNACLRNILFSTVATNIVLSTYCNATVENSTFNTSTCIVSRVYTNGIAPAINLTNCIFANVIAPSVGGVVAISGSYCGFYNSPGTYGVQNPITTLSNPFQTVAAGNNYLRRGSVFAESGTTQIDPSLKLQLKQLTTDPPLFLTNLVDTAVSTAVILTPQARRNMGTPDLGYHYKPIDYMAVRFMITNAPLVITNGAVIGLTGDNGILLLDGASISCEGSPTNINHFVEYRIVQEAPIGLGVTGNAYSVVPYRYGNGAMPGKFKFTEFSWLNGNYGGNLFSLNGVVAGSDGWTYTTLDISDCIFRQGNITLYAGKNTISFKNNIIENNTVYISANVGVSFFNNIWNSCDVFLDIENTSLYSLFDNVFYSCISVGGPSTIIRGYNAYINTPSTNYMDFGLAATDKVLTNMTWQVGALGNYYQPTNSTLINAGSRTAASAGLYHYTVLSNQTKEAATQVDIGVHYVATGSNGLPVDTDGDSVSDYLEDLNGDGSASNDPTAWNTYNSITGLTTNQGIRVFTPLK